MNRWDMQGFNIGVTLMNVTNHLYYLSEPHTEGWMNKWDMQGFNIGVALVNVTNHLY